MIVKFFWKPELDFYIRFKCSYSIYYQIIEISEDKQTVWLDAAKIFEKCTCWISDGSNLYRVIVVEKAEDNDVVS